MGKYDLFQRCFVGFAVVYHMYIICTCRVLQVVGVLFAAAMKGLRRRSTMICCVWSGTVGTRRTKPIVVVVVAKHQWSVDMY